MADNPYAPSNLGGAAPAPAAAPLPSYTPTYAPSPLPGAPSTGVYAPSNLSDPALVSAASGAILHHESGSTPTNLKNPTSYAGAVGPGQITPSTAKPYTLPGENLNNPADNYKIHQRIMADYARRWPNDPARWAVAYFSGPGNVSPPGSPTPWKKNTGDGNNTVSQYVANTVGKMGAGSGATLPATGAQPAAPAAAPANVGLALAALNSGTGGPGTKSTMDNLQSMAGGGGGESAPAPLDLQPQQAASAMGNVRQAQIAAMAPQLMAASRARGGLQGMPGPASSLNAQGIPMPIAASTPGAPQPPGTTLNSTGGLYG